jgi:AcrR family transcriptional regulator
MSTDPPQAPEVQPTVLPAERPGQEGGRRHANRLQRAAQLADAALPLLLERGVDAVTIDDVTRAAGVAKGSFYRYFGGKEELVAALVAPPAAAVSAAVARAAPSLARARTPAALRDAYAAFGAELVEVVLAWPGVVRFYLQERNGPPTPARAPVHALAAEVRAASLALTHAGRVHGLMGDLPPAVTSRAVLGAVHELLGAFLAGEDLGDPVEGALAVVRLVLEGLVRVGGAGDPMSEEGGT